MVTPLASHFQRHRAARPRVREVPLADEDTKSLQTSTFSAISGAGAGAGARQGAPVLAQGLGPRASLRSALGNELLRRGGGDVGAGGRVNGVVDGLPAGDAGAGGRVDGFVDGLPAGAEPCPMPQIPGLQIIPSARASPLDSGALDDMGSQGYACYHHHHLSLPFSSPSSYSVCLSLSYTLPLCVCLSLLPSLSLSLSVRLSFFSHVPP